MTTFLNSVGARIGAGEIDTFTAALTSAQILNSFTTPITVVPATTQRRLRKILSVMMQFTFVTTAYATNTTMSFFADTIGVSPWTANILGSMVINKTGTCINTFTITPVVSATNSSNMIINKSIKIATQTGNPTAGDGTINLWITTISYG